MAWEGLYQEALLRLGLQHNAAGLAGWRHAGSMWKVGERQGESVCVCVCVYVCFGSLSHAYCHVCHTTSCCHVHVIFWVAAMHKCTHTHTHTHTHAQANGYRLFSHKLHDEVRARHDSYGGGGGAGGGGRGSHGGGRRASTTAEGADEGAAAGGKRGAGKKGKAGLGSAVGRPCCRCCLHVGRARAWQSGHRQHTHPPTHPPTCLPACHMNPLVHSHASPLVGHPSDTSTSYR